MPITQEQFEEVCQKIEVSEFGIPTICKQVKISSRSFYEYLELNEHNEKRYARAKEKKYEFLLDQIHELENACLNAVKNIKDPRKANALVQAYKIKVDNLKWILSKLLPKKYGEKLDLTSGGDKIKPPGELKIIIDKNVDNSKKT